MNKSKLILIISIILTMSCGAAWYLIETKPTSRKQRPQTVRTLVSTIPAKVETIPLFIDARGTISPSQETSVQALVTAKIEEIADNCEVGALVKRGDILIQQEKESFLYTLASKKSHLAKAEAEYDLEMGQQEVARQEMQQLANLSSVFKKEVKASPLALREPHLATAKANVQIAKADVDLAQLNLDYTTLKAPYDAIILERNVSLGSLASPSTTLLTLANIDSYNIEVSVALDEIQALPIKKKDEVDITVITETGISRKASFEHIIPHLNENSRLGRVLIRIDDPLGIENNEPALILGDQVRVKLGIGEIENVVRIPSHALRSQDTIWIAKKVEAKKKISVSTAQDTKDAKSKNAENTQNQPKIKEKSASPQYVLEIRPVTVLWKDIHNAYISAGLNDGEEIIISNVPSPLQNMAVELEQ